MRVSVSAIGVIAGLCLAITGTAGAARLVRTQAGLFSVSCPSVRQCTSTDGFIEVTFNPRTGRRTGGGVRTVDPGGGSLIALSCPTRDECAAVDDSQGVVSFNPQTGRQTVRRGSIDPRAPQALACASRSQCTIGDAGGSHDHLTGGEITFDPRTGRRNTAGTQGDSIDNDNQGLNDLACPTVIQCTAIDGIGNELTFNPQTARLNAAGM